ncbi:DUF427 domain-containing protein [Oceanibium sediminis]|uniref:DUF427 domain-containing protein n=1 Tax=Oceanibium sediminis TaxID=2026339 RepID=UPI000DD4B42B|nr:DUF427 domain-containing protein [Oceanibium sediminis]
MPTKTLSVTAANGTWVIRAAGAVIGESSNALLLEEEGRPAIIYFPRSDVEMAFLDASDKTSVSPDKGTARYFSIAAKSGTIKDAAWSYEDPAEAVARVKDHLAFHASDKVAVEQL